jgi:Fe-S-cluster-containing hydrogenase component 2
MNSSIAILYVDENRCSGCGVCVSVCPHNAIVLEGGKASIRQALCNRCEACAAACPERAILSVTETALVPDLERTSALQGPELSGSGSAVARAAPVLSAALLFIGREVLPRVTDYVLGAIDRRVHQGSGDLVEGAQVSAGSRTTSASGRRRRRRHHGG